MTEPTLSRAAAGDGPDATMPSPWWRLDGFGRVQGPFGEAEMGADFLAGRLRLSDPVWSPGAPGWASFDSLFPRTAGDEPRTRFVAFLVALVAFAATATPVILPICGVLLWDIADLPPLPVLRMAHVGLAVAMGVATIAVVWSARRCAIRLRRRPGGRRALDIASTGLLGIGCVLTSLQGMATTIVPDELVGMAGWSFTVTRTADPDRIVIKGDVGIGFGKAVLAQLDAFPDPVRIEITSGGGVATEAMQVAEAVEKRPGATVIARETCDSACTFVLMAGTHRLADRDMTIGFHALSIVEAEEKRGTLFGFSLALAIADRHGDDFLRRRGVPSEMVGEANRRGHEGMYPIESETLRDRRVLTGLVDPLPEAIPDDGPEENEPKAGKPD